MWLRVWGGSPAVLVGRETTYILMLRQLGSTHTMPLLSPLLLLLQPGTSLSLLQLSPRLLLLLLLGPQQLLLCKVLRVQCSPSGCSKESTGATCCSLLLGQQGRGRHLLHLLHSWEGRGVHLHSK